MPEQLSQLANDPVATLVSHNQCEDHSEDAVADGKAAPRIWRSLLGDHWVIPEKLKAPGAVEKVEPHWRSLSRGHCPEPWVIPNGWEPLCPAVFTADSTAVKENDDARNLLRKDIEAAQQFCASAHKQEAWRKAKAVQEKENTSCQNS